MKDCDESVEINHKSNWLYLPDHPYRILIIGGSLFLMNVRNNYPFESKYQLLISGRVKQGL